jgi:hypothetical protein
MLSPSKWCARSGKQHVVKYRGKLSDDTINGTIEAPGHDGGEAVKSEWHAQRATNKKADDAKRKTS